MRDDIILAGGARTAIGALGGIFAGMPATALGAAAIRGSILRAGLDPNAVDEVIMGNVLSAGLGQNPARQAAIGAGLPTTCGATTVNKVCGSGLKAIMLAAQGIQSGDAHVVIAGGMENMSRAPYLLEQGRTGYRLGNGEVVDSLIRDGLWDCYGNTHMGTLGNQCAVKYGFSRAQQDDFAVTSYQRAQAAAMNGYFAREIVTVETPAGRGAKITIAEDESPKRFDEKKLRQLRPAFGEEGSITAGNASSLNDGAASIVITSAAMARSLKIVPVAKILGYATSSGDPEWFTLAPIGALQRLMKQTGLKTTDVDLFEINEAFAVVAMAAMRELSLPHEKVNVFGGAVALGHPIGASGARVVVTLLNALEHTGGHIGVATLCIGGGEAVAIAVERC